MSHPLTPNQALGLGAPHPTQQGAQSINLLP